MSGLTEAVRSELSLAVEILAHVQEDQIEVLMDGILEAEDVFVSGAGRTGYVARCLAMRLMQMGFHTHVVGDSVTPRIGKKDLLIACSVSGKTQTTCILSASAARIGAKVIAITSDKSSPLAEVARAAVILPWPLGNPPKMASAMEMAMLLFFDGLVSHIMGERGITEEDLLSRHTNLE